MGEVHNGGVATTGVVLTMVFGGGKQCLSLWNRTMGRETRFLWRKLAVSTYVPHESREMHRINALSVVVGKMAGMSPGDLLNIHRSGMSSQASHPPATASFPKKTKLSNAEVTPTRPHSTCP